MKKIIVCLAAVAALAVAGAFTLQQQTEKGIARVNRVQGYYIFIQCQPVAEYEMLGSVKKTGITWSGSPDEMFNTLIRRAKKEYPRCDGIIFDDVAMEHASCIAFK